MPNIVPFLWFDTQAEDAANHYVSIFRNSRITKVTRWGKTGPGPEGAALTVEFELDGKPFIALNGGPQFTVSEAVSFSVGCQTQAEIDEYWDKLSSGGQEGPCGWLKDKFGLSWQVNPVALGRMLQDPDREKADRAMKAMMGMKKFDIAALEKAFNGV
jgi:predicted 3-demethylubiquinone-9 3-methyltransferase (glyoxalase superfamily)